MMSLFTSFDVKFFNVWFFIFFILFVCLKSETYFNNSMKFYFFKFSNFMQIFFQSTKNKMYTKGANLVLLSLLFFLFMINLSSLFPYSFTPTAQISVVLFSSMLFWLSLFMFYTLKNMHSFLSHCIPEGSPLGLVILLFFIELVSMLIRPLTLTVRLSANIIAGHVIMNLLFSLSYFFPPMMIFYLIINMVEFFVCFIQAWIFTTLIALYYSEIN